MVIFIRRAKWKKIIAFVVKGMSPVWFLKTFYVFYYNTSYVIRAVKIHDYQLSQPQPRPYLGIINLYIDNSNSIWDFFPRQVK